MKFSIRDIMFVTVLVAVCTAWCVDRQRLAAEIDRLKKEAEYGLMGEMYSGMLMPNSSAPAPSPNSDFPDLDGYNWEIPIGLAVVVLVPVLFVLVSRNRKKFT